jgi:hypothetical protein
MMTLENQARFLCGLSGLVELLELQAVCPKLIEKLELSTLKHNSAEALRAVRVVSIRKHVHLTDPSTVHNALIPKQMLVEKLDDISF